MRKSKFALFALLLLTMPLLVMPAAHAQTNSVYFSVEPVAIAPLTNSNASINGLETPQTPSPVGQNFTVDVHLIGATAGNAPMGISGVEIHVYFGDILNYCKPLGFTDMLGTAGGVLNSPVLETLSGFYDSSGTSIPTFPYTNATFYEVAGASTAITGWNGADGIIAKIMFQIIKQPQSSQGETTAYLPLSCDFTDLLDTSNVEVPHGTVQGTLTIDATSAPPITYSLAVKVVGGGTVTQNPSNTAYANGTIVTLTAVPNTGWTFQGWSGDVTGTQNPVNVTMNGNKSVNATFIQGSSASYSLTVDVVGGGTVTQNPSNTAYANGTIVTLTAVPNTGWTFQGWSGDVTGTQNPASITMNGNKTVTATFANASPPAFGGNIDLFTQKTPFSGRGPNQSSDAFQQQELVILYALVTFGGAPVANKVVAFQVNGPPNSLQNITIIGAAVTNSSGIAEFSFRIPTAPSGAQQTVFGVWFALATVDVDQVVLIDTLTFQVGWIISIKSIVTLNQELVPQTSFARQDTVVFNLTLENIAMTPKTATITVDTQDVDGNAIMHAELDNLVVPPGESFAQTSSQIPDTAKIGEANVSATAYTAAPSSGGTPYSPSVFTTFNIITAEYYTLTVKVIGSGSVSENPASTSYLKGTTVTLNAVSAANWTFQGWSGDLTGVENPANITMNGNKIVTATFTQVTKWHDVAITDVRIFPSQVNAGGIVHIMIVAANLGTYTENFNVTVYYDRNIIQEIPIASMLPHTSNTLAVDWNTTNVNPGVYPMSANATIVEGDINPNNNNFIDGQITITSAPVPARFILLPAILVLSLMGLGIMGGATTLVLFAAYYLRRRKRKTGETPQYVIVSHPHI